MSCYWKLSFALFLLFSVFSARADNLKIRWAASESEKAIWTMGFKGTGPEGPVLSFKLILPDEYPLPDLKLISEDYEILKEVPQEVHLHEKLCRWGARGNFKGYPYVELLVYALQEDKKRSGAKLLTSLEIELQGIAAFEPNNYHSSDCSPLLLNNMFVNYWDACEYRHEHVAMGRLENSVVPQAVTSVYRVKVNSDGIKKLTRAYLAANGVDLSAALPANFHMTSRGTEIPILILDQDGDFSDEEDAIIFFGQKLSIRNRSIWNGGDFTDGNVYYLYGDDSPGLRMAAEDVAPDSYPAFPTTTTFVSNVIFETNDFMDWANHMRPNGERWFWSPALYYFPGSGEKSRTVSLNLPHPVSNTDSFSLTVHEGGMNNVLHVLESKINTGSYASLTFSGRTVASLGYSFAQSLLASGGSNTLTLRIPSSQTLSDNQILDAVSVSYLRTADVDADTLLIEDNGGDKRYVAGTSTCKFSATPYVLDLSDKNEATGLYLPKIGINAGYSSGIVTFDAAGQEGSRKYYLSTQTSDPLSIEKVTTTDLSQGCELLIITHADFHPSGSDAAWQDYLARRENKFSVLSVDSQEIYDRHSYGIFDPTAIRSFLNDAFQTWSVPPSYILLLGDGSVDYKNYLGDAGFKNRVPTMIIEDTSDFIEQGWHASDGWFADCDEDGYPDVPVGRIPVRDYGELAGVFGKIAAYEDQAVDEGWLKKQFYVSDVNDGALDFEACNDSLKTRYAVSPFQSSQVYYGDSVDEDSCAAAIVSGWDDALVVHFAGHSGHYLSHSFWGAEDGMLSLYKVRNDGKTDLQDMPVISAPDAHLPFLLNSTCYMGGFQYFVDPLLTESLFKASDRGTIGSTGFSTASYLGNQKKFAEGFFEELYGLPKERTLGDAVEYARFGLASTLNEVSSLVLFGDPTLEFPLPSVPAPLNFTGTPGNGSATLNWNHPSPSPSKYDIYRSSDGGVTYYKINTLGYPLDNFTDTGLTNTQTYIYYAVSVDPSGFASPPSDYATVVPLNPAAPSAPTGLKAVDPGVGDRLMISWNSNGETDLSYYKLYRGTSPGSYSYTQQFSKSTTSFQMTGLAEGVKYYFAMTATNTSGKESSYSAEASAVPTSSPVAVKVPAMITDLTIARSGESDLMLTWSKPLVDIKGNATTVVSFDIYRVTNADVDGEPGPDNPYNYDLDKVPTTSPNAKISVPAISGQTVHTYLDTGAVSKASTVTYIVVAVDSAGNRGPASHNPPASILSLMVTKNSPTGPFQINFSPVTTTIDGTPTSLIAGYRLYGFLSPMESSKDHVAPSHCVAEPIESQCIFAEELAPGLPASSCDGSSALYCDNTSSVPLLYTVVAVDNRGNTSLY